MKNLVKAYLREKKGSKCYSCILKWEEDGKPKSKEISTGIEIKGNNKRLAKKRIEEIREDFEKKVTRNGFTEYKDMLFETYIEKWVSEQENFLKPTTLSGYNGIVKNHIIPFFSKRHILLVDIKPLEVPITLCCHYALRRGEVLGLQWKNVDFDKRVITICSSVVRAGKAIFQESTKTLSSNRILPMDDEIYNYLKVHKKRQKNNCDLFGNMYSKNDFVCTWDDGRPFSPEYLSHAFKRILKKNNFPNIRFHDIRHSVATGLLNSGIDLKVIQEYLGHSTIGITANYYLHPDINEKSKALQQIGRLLQ